MDERSTKRLRLSAALARFPQRALERLQHLLQSEKGTPIITQKVAKKILQPAFDCYDRLSCQSIDGSPIYFFASRIQDMLAYTLADSEPYRELWNEMQGGAIDILTIHGRVRRRQRLSHQQLKGVLLLLHRRKAAGSLAVCRSLVSPFNGAITRCHWCGRWGEFCHSFDCPASSLAETGGCLH